MSRATAWPRGTRDAAMRPSPARSVDLARVAFPGCTPRRLPRSRIDTWEGRLEFWDAETEIAWVAEPTSPYHEAPAQALCALAVRLAAVRGAPVVCYGHMDLLLRDAAGRPRRILQADQSVYLHPGRARLPGPSAMVIGEHDYPDVVLEVDHSTDVRRGKLGLYEEWGFPEVWVEVPDRRAASRAKRRRSGVTIHLLDPDAGVFRTSPASRAFPGWTADEIHAAFNETTPSSGTHAVLARVGAALGAREGTGPEDDPILHAQRREARLETVRQILQARGIALPVDDAVRAAAGRRSARALVAAALACADAADFMARLRGRDGPS